MDLRTRDYSAEDRKRLGDALTARRVAVRPAWANRAEFIRATGISKKLAERLETGWPGSYRTSTLAVVARAYRVTLESIAATLDGGQLVPLPEDAPAQDAEDAAVLVLRRALLPGENIIRESGLDPEYATDLIVALRGEDVPELIVSLVENRRRARRGSGS